MIKLYYQTLRNNAVNKKNKLYPAYNHVREEKQKCITEGGIEAGDYNAEVNLQNLMDHTVKRIHQSGNMDKIKEGDVLSLVSKVGFDGCTGQSIYKQLTSEESELASIAVEESLFLTCLVPLQVRNQDGEVVWTNPKPSSTLYCCPIRFQYTKEDADTVAEEAAFIEDAKKTLVPTMLEGFRVKHKLEMTMIDGKVATILSEVTNATTSCSICGIKCGEMNNLDVLEKLLELSLLTSLTTGYLPFTSWGKSLMIRPLRK